MKKVAVYMSRQLGHYIPFHWLVQRKHPLFMPFYHVVSDIKLPYIRNYFYRNIVQFEKELDFYLRYFKPVSLEEVLGNPQGRQPVFHLSFDDGLRQCAEIIAPILLRKGIPATFFVNSAFVDNRGLYHRFKAGLIWKELKSRPVIEVKDYLAKQNLRGEKILSAGASQVSVLDTAAEMLEFSFTDFLEKEKPYMTKEHLTDLTAKGFSVGGHSHNHPEFWKISQEEQLDQVKRSMDWIDKNMNQRIRVFAFPYTDAGVPAGVLEKIRNQNICTATFGTAGLKYDSFADHYQRYPVEQTFQFKAGLKAEFVYFELRKLIGKHIVRH